MDTIFFHCERSWYLRRFSINIGIRQKIEMFFLWKAKKILRYAIYNIGHKHYKLVHHYDSYAIALYLLFYSSHMSFLLFGLRIAEKKNKRKLEIVYNSLDHLYLTKCSSKMPQKKKMFFTYFSFHDIFTSLMPWYLGLYYWCIVYTRAFVR